MAHPCIDEGNYADVQRARGSLREDVRARRGAELRGQARRNKLFGLWAAGKLGLTGDEAEAYAKAVVTADFEATSGVLRKVRTDFEAHGVALSEHRIRRTMDELMEQAIAQIKAGG